jgi:hypothetical protein
MLKYHTNRTQFVCSGTKQMKVIMALHMSDQPNGTIGRVGLSSDIQRTSTNNGGCLSF